MPPKLWVLINQGGRGAFHAGGSGIERGRGRHGSDYVGMSSGKTGEKPVRRKPKVSVAMLFSHGLVGS
jgi:hypothetical protein